MTMRPRHAAAMRLALEGELASPVIEQLLTRLGKAKRRRQSVKPINRNRKAVTGPRAAAKRTIAAFLEDARRDIAKQVIAARGALLGKAEASAAEVESILDSIDFSGWEELRSKLEPVLLAVMQDGVAVAFSQIGFDAPADIVDQVNEKAVAWAMERSADLVGMTYDEDGNLVENPDPDMAITDSTRAMLRTDVAQAITEGWSVDEFADELADNYAFSSDRAGSIAHFEIAQADVEGNMTAYRDSGMVSGKEWLLGSEHDDDDECDDAAAMGVVPLDSDFGGIGDPPAHPHCVCDVLPVLADDTD